MTVADFRRKWEGHSLTPRAKPLDPKLTEAYAKVRDVCRAITPQKKDNRNDHS